MPAFLLPTTDTIQKYTVYHYLASKMARKRQTKMARINVTVAGGIVNVAASVLSFMIHWATWLAAV